MSKTRKQSTPLKKSARVSVFLKAEPAGLYRNLKIAFAILIATMSFALYAPSINYEFAYDDYASIGNNKITVQGMKAIPEIMVTDYWAGLEESLRVKQYRPMPLVLFATLWDLSENNAHLFHLASVILYAISCLIVFLLLCRLFRKHSIILPFTAALLFVTHPVHTEVVCNIKSVDEILCLIFAGLSVLFAFRYVDRNSIFSLILSAVAFGLSLLSKETGIAYLLLTPVLLYVFSEVKTKQIVLTGSILLIVTVLFLAMRAWVIRDVPDIPMSYINNALAKPSELSVVKATAIYTVLWYLGILLFPHPLRYDYSYNMIPFQDLSSPGFLAAILILGGLLLYALLNLKKKSFLAAAILFFFLTLAPVSNVFLLIGSSMAERFLFMPSIALSMVFAILLSKFIQTGKTDEIKSVKESFFMNRKLLTVAIILSLAYSMKTLAQSENWRNNHVLFKNNLKYCNKSARAHFNRAADIKLQYEKLKTKDQSKDSIQLALNEFLIANEIAKPYPGIDKVLAYCYNELKDYEKALYHYTKTLEFTKEPDAGLYITIGGLYNLTGQYSKAKIILDSAMKVDHKSAEGYNSYGYAWEKIGNIDSAIVYYQKAVETDTSYVIAYGNLALIYFNNNKPEQAIRVCLDGLKYDSLNASMLCTLGGSYSNLNMYDKAIVNLQKAISADPTYKLSYRFLGVTYQKMGNLNKANEYYAKAG